MQFQVEDTARYRYGIAFFRRNYSALFSDELRSVLDGTTNEHQ